MTKDEYLQRLKQALVAPPDSAQLLFLLQTTGEQMAQLEGVLDDLLAKQSLSGSDATQ